MGKRTRRFGAALLVALLGVLGLGRAQAQPTQTFTLAPGGRATITFIAFCTNYGQNFPDQVQAPDGLADANIRGALAYIQQQGIGDREADALDAQYGIWRVQGVAGSPQGGQIANDVVSAAGTPVQEPQGTSLLDAAQSGQVQVAVASWQPLGQKVDLGTVNDYFYGRGTLTVTNTSGQELTLYHPVGALYAPTSAGNQTMAAYMTNVDVQNPQPTPQPTSQPSQLPNTGAGDGALSIPALGLAALLLLALGWGLSRSRGRL